MSKRSNKKSTHVARSPLLPDDDSDGRSVQSEQRGADSEDDTKESNHEFKLEDLIENLSEKRATARVAALKAFCGELRSKYSKDALSGRLDTVQSRLESCLRKGASDEIVQASTALALVVITLGADAERTHKEFYELLHTMLLDQAKSVTARAAIARTYGLSLFIAGDEGESEKELQLMLDIATDRRNYANGPDLVTSALQSWALIASTLPHSVLGTRLFSQFTPRFAALLDEESLEVRSAAGEVLALLYSQHREWLEERQTEDSAADAVIDVNALTDKLEELSTEGAKHIAKETRKKQRQVFRDILATFEEGEVPSETLTVGQRKHTFRGWANARRLDTLRAVLEAGLAVHLKQNELMGQVFEISVSGEEEDDETRAARRADLIEASKAKEKAAYERDTKQRKKKAAALMHEDE